MKQSIHGLNMQEGVSGPGASLTDDHLRRRQRIETMYRVQDTRCGDL
jgi:hypothetical protein